jgi:hypothetical protein
MATTTQHQTAPPTHTYYWETGAVDILRETTTSDFSNGVDAFLQERSYQLRPGGPAPLETWIGDNRYLLVGRYPHVGVTIVVSVESFRGYKSFMKVYGHLAAELAQELVPQAVAQPDNLIVDYPLPRLQATW